jgi:hypothetical protein
MVAVAIPLAASALLPPAAWAEVLLVALLLCLLGLLAHWIWQDGLSPRLSYIGVGVVLTLLSWRGLLDGDPMYRVMGALSLLLGYIAMVAAARPWRRQAPNSASAALM